jgi:hypothetical protein
MCTQCRPFETLSAPLLFYYCLGLLPSAMYIVEIERGTRSVEFVSNCQFVGISAMVYVYIISRCCATQLDADCEEEAEPLPHDIAMSEAVAAGLAPTVLDPDGQHHVCRIHVEPEGQMQHVFLFKYAYRVSTLPRA